MVVHAMQLIASDKKHIVVGLGKTGQSCVRYLLGQGAQVEVVDTRTQPPGLDDFVKAFPSVPVRLGELDADYLSTADDLVVSPGVPIKHPMIQRARENGTEITGDIDIFSCVAEAPIIAITGSNGKSTVTTLLGDMAKKAGTKVAIGGNLGTPALDLIDPAVELYVLELSSFQLETTRRLGAMSATVLNVSEDHMDRYSGMPEYHAAKHRIFYGATNAVVNDDLPLTAPLMAQGMQAIHYGLGNPGLKKFSTIMENSEQWIVHGYKPIMRVAEMRLKGKHNLYNALAALSLGHTAGIPLEDMIATLKEYPGLHHRCEYIRTVDGVDYINDSKGTNVGATRAAVESLGDTCSGQLVLIAGGEGKGADFTPLRDVVENYCKAVVLIGRDAPEIARVLPEEIIHRAETLEGAVQQARHLAEQSDMVLLSPACASFDMFESYEHRGAQFSHYVRQM